MISLVYRKRVSVHNNLLHSVYTVTKKPVRKTVCSKQKWDVIIHSLDGHHAVITQSSGSHQAVIRQLSGSNQTVILMHIILSGLEIQFTLLYSRKQKHVLLFRKSEILFFKVSITTMPNIFFRNKTFLFLTIMS